MINIFTNAEPTGKFYIIKRRFGGFNIMLEWSYIDEHPSEKQTGYFKASLNELKKFNFKIKKCDDPYTGKMYIKRNFWGGVDLFMEYRSSNICEITLDHGPEFTTYHQINEEKLQNFEFELESK